MASIFASKAYLICGTLLLILPVNGQRRQFDLAPEIPSHLPAPPKGEPPPPPSNSSGNGNVTGQLGVPPQNVVPEPLGPGIPPGEFVPFGLNHIILIIVPQFKTKFNKLPEWVASSVKISMPITVFFDQLDVPPGMLIPGAGGFPLPPLGIPPMAAGPIPPPPFPPNLPGPGAQMSASSGYYSYRPYLYGHKYGGDSEDVDEEGYDIDSDNDNYYSEEDRALSRKRRKRETCANQTVCSYPSNSEILEYQLHARRKRAVDFNSTVHKSERASIIPKLEKILNSAGLKGRHCLLRAICEVHEGPLHHYGLMGEILTMFFSISRSIFAESHLPEYVRAEQAGKTGDCSEFQRQCESTMFSWEKKKRNAFKYYGP